MKSCGSANHSFLPVGAVYDRAYFVDFREKRAVTDRAYGHAVKTRTGSTLVARRAGNAHAETATAVSPIIAAPIIHGFVEWIP